MRLLSASLVRSCAIGASLFCALPLACGVARADEGDDWAAVNKLRAQIGDETFRKEPAKAVAQLEEFNATHALDPILAADLTVQAAQITRDQLNKPDEAMKLLDAGLASVKPDAGRPVEIMYIAAQGATLLTQNKAADAQKLLKDNFKLIEAAAKSGHPHLATFASRAIEHLCDAQDAVRPVGAKPNDNIELLEYAMRELPAFIDPNQQRAADWREGWMYERLIGLLAKQGRADEALQWGRLYFGEVAFEEAAIQRAIKPLSGVWARTGDLAKVRAFANAQTAADAAAKDAPPNPLQSVTMPEFGDKSAVAVLLKQLQAEQTANWQRERVARAVTLQIALADWSGAMNNALDLLVEDATLPDGPQQVARVFKAHDGSLVRANAFLAYLDGKADNPVPTFLAQDGGGKTP